MKKYFKYFIIFICSTLLIIFSSIFLRKICVENLLYNNMGNYINLNFHAQNSSKTPTFLKQNLALCNFSTFSIDFKTPNKHAFPPSQAASISTTLAPNTLLSASYALSPSPTYLLLYEDKIIYKTSNLTEEIVTAPKTYYAEALSATTENVIKVSYNGITGFISNTDVVAKTPTANIFQTKEATTATDAGTYLREKPNTTSKKLALIPSSSPLHYIGYIKGETPSDGTSNLWYLVDFELGPTTTHRGYVFAERVTLSSPLEQQATLNQTQDAGLQEPTQTIETPETLTGNITLSKGVKWFLIILFSTLAIIIFALIALAPKREKQLKQNKPKTIPTAENNSTANPPLKIEASTTSHIKKIKKPCKITPYSARSAPEFSNEFIEFKNSPNQIGTEKPKKNKPDFPPYLSKYFKISAYPDDDEPL